MKPEREPYIRIIVGIGTLAILPLLGIAHFGPDDWFTNLQNWQSGVGAFWGALFGLGAILIGALFNADLNRKRDDRLREQDTVTLAAALQAEVGLIIESVRGFDRIFAGVSDNEPFLPGPTRPRSSPSIRSQFHILQANTHRLDLLGAPIVDKVVRFYRLAGLVLEHDEAIDGDNESLAFRKGRVFSVVEHGKIVRILLRVRAGLPNWPDDPFRKTQPESEADGDA